MQPRTSSSAPFELARGTANVEEIRKTLRREGYSNVDAHLGGASIRAQLKKQFVEGHQA